MENKITRDDVAKKIQEQFETMAFPDKCKTADKILDLLEHVQQHNAFEQLSFLKIAHDIIEEKTKDIIKSGWNKPPLKLLQWDHGDKNDND